MAPLDGCHAQLDKGFSVMVLKTFRRKDADMADTQDKSSIARELSEQALGEYAKGNKAKGDQLAEQAVKTDRAAVEEVVNELEEDARTTGTPDVSEKTR